MRPLRVVLLPCLWLAVGCGSSIPPSQSTGFAMATDSLAFQNFATGYYDSVLDADAMVRMFGTGVCANTTSPCALTPVASAWMNKANDSMAGGRCEGFAVLGNLLFTGDVSAVGLGGYDARSLELDGNVALQRELAYWFSTQLVPKVVSEQTKSFQAKDVMPFLAEQLKPEATERWRVGIVKKQNGRLSGGHALTPIGYYSGERDGLYYLRVYDNNNPDTERAIAIDTKANRWEYEAARNPQAKSSLYFGDDSNQNPLYFAPVRNRLGTLPCPFCPQSGSTVVLTSGGVEATLAGTGVQDGKLVAASGASVAPVLTDDLGSEPAAMLLAVPATTEASISLRNGSEDPAAAGAGSLVAYGEGYVVAVDGLSLADATSDSLTISGAGTSVRYDSTSKTPLSMSTLVQSAGGAAVEISVTLTGSSGGAEIDLNAATGGVTVKTRQATGTGVTVGVTRTTEDGKSQSGQLSFQGTGTDTLSAQTASLGETGSLTGEVTDEQGKVTPVTDGCLDGKVSGKETDLDCGGGCPRTCAVDQGCLVSTDCASGFCNASTKKCVATGCEDGVRGQDETDADCGGETCAACTVTRACALDRDCASGACLGKACVPTFSVGFTVAGMPFGATLLLRNNGADDLSIEVDGSYAFPRRVTGAYEVTIARQPGIAECTLAHGSGTAVADVTDVSITCVPLWSIGGTLAGLPVADSVTLTNNGADTLVLDANGTFAFASLVKGAYHAVISVQPAGARCTLEHGDGTATGNVTDLTVTCWATCAALALDCGHGACTDVGGPPRCVCDTGYEGTDCRTCATGYQDKNTDGSCLPDCDHSGLGTCSGHGSCSDTSGTATCGCDTGYSGPTCAACDAGYQDKNTDGTCLPDCDHSGLGTCSGHGFCSDTSGTATCGCDTGYDGPTCAACATGYQDKDTDGSCLPDCDHSGLGTCSGHGSCSDISGTATCACTSPWTGPVCASIGPYTTMLGGSGGERPTGIAVDPANGNLYVLASTNSATIDFGGGVTTAGYGDADVLLLALDPAGAPRWARDLGGTLREDAGKVVVDSAGNVVLTGSTYSSTLNFDATHSMPAAAIRPFVVSYSASGDFRWARVFGSGEGTALVPDASGNVVAAGSAGGGFDYDEAGPLPTLTPTANGVYVVSLDTNGATRWANVYGSSSGGPGTLIRDLATDSAGNLYATGYIGAPNASFGGAALAYNVTCNCSEIFVASWDAGGAHRWSKGFVGVDFRSYEAFAVATDGAGRLALGARYADAIDFGGGNLTHPNPGNGAGALVLFDAATGGFLSQRLFTTGLPFVIYDLAFDASGLYMVGNSNNTGGDLGAGVQPSGAFWAQYSLGAGDSLDYVAGRVAGGGAYPLATGVCIAPDGAVLATGDTSGSIDWGSGSKTTSGSWDLWLARLK